MGAHDGLPAPAWYADPYGVSEFRWWDGTQWTDAVHPPAGGNVEPEPSEPIDPEPIALTETGSITTALVGDAVRSALQGAAPSEPILTQSIPGARVFHEDLAAPALTSTGPLFAEVPTTGGSGLRADETTDGGTYSWTRESQQFDSAPRKFVGLAERGRTTMGSITRFSPTQSNTTSVWLIVSSPVFAFALFVGATLGIAAMPAMRSVAIPFELLTGGVALTAYLITMLFALNDHNRLLDFGYREPAHWAWTLLSASVYLAMRTVAIRRETGRMTPPFWVHLAVTVALVLGVLSVAGQLLALLVNVVVI